MAYATAEQLRAYLGIKNSDTFTATAATDLLTLNDTDITWATGDEVFVSTTTTLPPPLAASTLYFVIYDSPLNVQLATTKASADAGTAINLTGSGSGTHTITRSVTDNDLLSDLLDRVTEAIDQYTGRSFTASSSASRYYESDALDKDTNTLWLDNDCLTVTSLKNGDDDTTTIPSTEYWLVDRNQGPPYYGIRLKSDSDYSWEWDTDGWVEVTGTWGYSTTAPADIVHACIRWAAYAYHQKDAPVYDVQAFPESGVITVPQGIPTDVERILAPYKRLV